MREQNAPTKAFWLSHSKGSKLPNFVQEGDTLHRGAHLSPKEQKKLKGNAPDSTGKHVATTSR